MIELLRSPWGEHFESLIGEVSDSLVIACPYVGRQPCEALLEVASQTGAAKSASLLLLTDLSRDVILSGASDLSAICDLSLGFQSAEVRFLPNVHAKVYVADEKAAIVTSANMTASGLWRNFEYGLQVRDPHLVAQIRRDVVDYAELGTSIGEERLRFLSRLSQELNEVRRHADASVKRDLRSRFRKRLREFENEIIRARAAGRTPHAIFADAILYLLAKGPMTTAELHPLIRSIHPDLCDDSTDRVIDGRHFGKKWKHAVRTAQQHLKRKGRIALHDGVWCLTDHNANDAP